MGTTHLYVDPLSSEAAAKMLNEQYMGSTGVFLRFINVAAKNLYYCGDGCFNGQCDCRVSGALISHRWMIDEKKPKDSSSNGTTMVTGFGDMPVAIAFNQTMVVEEVGKCYYQFDG